MQRAANLGDGVEHVAQAVEIGGVQAAHVVFGAQRARKARAFAGFERQTEAHGIGNGQDVREENGGVEREALKRLKRHLGGVGGVLGERQEAAGLGAGGVVFGQVPARLAHEPDRRVLGRLAQQGAQESIVLQSLGHVEAVVSEIWASGYFTRVSGARTLGALLCRA